MHYRLATIAHVSQPLSCDLCHRRHRVVATFREVTIIVPGDPCLPARVVDLPGELTVGPRCARKLLDSVLLAYREQAIRMLGLPNL